MIVSSQIKVLCHSNWNSTWTPCRSRPLLFRFTFTFMNCKGATSLSLNVATQMNKKKPGGKAGKHTKRHTSDLMVFQTEKYREAERTRRVKLVPSSVCTQSAGLASVCREPIDAGFYSLNTLLHLWHRDSVMMTRERVLSLKPYQNNKHFHLFTTSQSLNKERALQDGAVALNNEV